MDTSTDGHDGPDAGDAVDRRTHPNVLRLREIFAALAAGDPGPAYAATHEDFLNVNDIGAGPWREQRGRDTFYAFFADFCALFDERPFGQEILDALGWDDHVLAVVRETGAAQGQVFDNRAIYLIAVDPDGRWTSLRTLDMDQDSLRRFWAGVTLPAGAPAWEGVAGAPVPTVPTVPTV
ncbi:nuclear transport factor 2 family protein [Pseudonocardia kujensis]|uniref:nuclear transport factor 2 family protein n=1 Tax=Pseudonocardia kujensis TaxID=1128675 RepID=UPI001E4A7741|nr:nuclear transport factor 2 family protein [Pseudonocardia kujensis]MCE0767904.1 nuclear transport factor 2 family protein [Pseudonocardia kujensis]